MGPSSEVHGVIGVSSCSVAKHYGQTEVSPKDGALTEPNLLTQRPSASTDVRPGRSESDPGETGLEGPETGGDDLLSRHWSQRFPWT